MRPRRTTWTRLIRGLFSNPGPDEELGKRDDDLVYSGPSSATTAVSDSKSPGSGVVVVVGPGGWKPTASVVHRPSRMRRRRFWLMLSTLCMLGWMIFRNRHSGSFSVPTTDSEHPQGLTWPATPDRQSPTAGETVAIKLAWDRVSDEQKETVRAKQTYDGPIQLPRLSDTLDQIRHTRGSSARNNNVLFIAADVQSVSTLVPMACRMANRGRNHVHFMLLSRHDADLDTIRSINGVSDQSSCPVIWHDGRPDQAPVSTVLRARVAMIAAFSLVDVLMHPQAVIVDDLQQEDNFFLAEIGRMRSKSAYPIIELHRSALSSLSWLADLSASSLHHWNSATIDILIEPSADSVDLLPRLLESILRADYRGLPIPRLIFDLPAGPISETVSDLLAGLSWPPRGYFTPAAIDSRWRPTNLVVVRHRMPSSRMTPEEASVRFLEAFHPATPASQHVLVLTPRVQLSAGYFQYLFFTMLEYRYGDDETSFDLAGLSLVRPTVALDGITALPDLQLSSIEASKEQAQHQPSTTHPAPFLWQAPVPDATLFFGDKWAELQAFASNRIAVFHQSRRQHEQASAGNAVPSPIEMKQKLVSVAYPSWTEYAAELFLAKAYTVLVPGLRATEGTFAALHPEAYRLPDDLIAQLTRPGYGHDHDHDDDKDKGKDPTPDATEPTEPFHLPSSIPATLPADVSAGPEPLAPSTDLSAILPPLLDFPASPSSPDSSSSDSSLPGLSRRILPQLSKLTRLQLDGSVVTGLEMQSAAVEYLYQFRTESGGCGPDGKTVRAAFLARVNVDSLFCLSPSSPSRSSGSNVGGGKN